MIRRLIARGAALDERSVYVFARLSPRSPHGGGPGRRRLSRCRHRGAGGLTRALVATALAEARRGTPMAATPTPRVAAALGAAARHGLAGIGVDPFSGQAVDACALRSRRGPRWSARPDAALPRRQRQ